VRLKPLAHYASAAPTKPVVGLVRVKNRNLWVRALPLFNPTVLLNGTVASLGPLVPTAVRRPAMTEPAEQLRFPIAQAFDPNDEVARWLTVLAMASNDVWRLFEWMEQGGDQGTRVLAFRLEAAALYEAASHLIDTPTRRPAIQSFLAGLPGAAQAEKDRVCGAIDPKSPHYVGEWIKSHRNVTFHYAIVHPERAAAEQEEIKLALERAIVQEIDGKITITGGGFGDVRFDFADEVAVQWLPDVDTEEGQAQIAALREVVVALARFVQRAIGAHLDTLPDGVVTRHG
jgi:hypothetical protein